MDENDSWILYGVALDRLSASKLERSEAYLELSARNRTGGIVALRLGGFENSQSCHVPRRADERRSALLPRERLWID